MHCPQKKRVTSCAYFCTFCFLRVFRFVCLFVFSVILFIVFRLCFASIYVFKCIPQQPLLAFFFNSGLACICVSVCVECVCVVCASSFFMLSQYDDAHLNSWLLADFIVFNETDSSRICCSFWLFFCPAHTHIVPLSLSLCLLLFSIFACCLSGLQITRHLFSSGHSLKPI